MKTHFGISRRLVPVLVAGCLMIPASMRAAESADSALINKLLADAKAEASELRTDSEDMRAFTSSKMSWESYARKVEMIREHINNTGKLLAKLKDAESTGLPWQQTAIRRIEPLLRELASNTEATINHLNGNRARVHFPAFQDLTAANLELATHLEALIRDFVSYGESKQKMEDVGRKLEVIS